MEALPFGRTWWIDEGRVLGGRYPGSPDRQEQVAMLGALLDAGFGLIVNLQEADERGNGDKPFPDYAPLAAELAAKRGLAVETCRFPIRDASVPTPALMRRIIDRIAEGVASGRRVYVHCWGGHGRTATVGGCWIVRQGATPEQALRMICARRAHDDHLRIMPSPETAAQREFILAWPQHDERTHGHGA